MTTILVDGHNALHRLGLRTGRHERDRRELLLRVREVAPDATVFFDARHAPRHLPEVAREEGLRVRYARRGEADAAILDFVRDADRPTGVTVVTDDLELARSARQLGAKTLAVRELFADLGVRPEPPEKEPGPDTFRPEDFGLPRQVNLDHPPHEMRED